MSGLLIFFLPTIKNKAPNPSIHKKNFIMVIPITMRMNLLGFLSFTVFNVSWYDNSVTTTKNTMPHAITLNENRGKPNKNTIIIKATAEANKNG